MKFKPTIKSAFLLLVFAFSTLVHAQAEQDTPSILGKWDASAVINRNELNIALTFFIENNELRATLISDGLGVYGLPADSVKFNGLQLISSFSRLGAELSGWLRLNDAKDKVIRIDGDWFQSAELVPIVLLPIE